MLSGINKNLWNICLYKKRCAVYTQGRQLNTLHSIYTYTYSRSRYGTNHPKHTTGRLHNQHHMRGRRRRLRSCHPGWKMFWVFKPSVWACRLGFTHEFTHPRGRYPRSHQLLHPCHVSYSGILPAGAGTFFKGYKHLCRKSRTGIEHKQYNIEEEILKMPTCTIWTNLKLILPVQS